MSAFFQIDLKIFVDILERANNEFDKLEKVANNIDKVLNQIAELEAWSGSVMPKHEQLENLNWIAGQLMSATGVSEGSSNANPLKISAWKVYLYKFLVSLNFRIIS